jgi:hypothetical protein
MHKINRKLKSDFTPKKPQPASDSHNKKDEPNRRDSSTCGYLKKNYDKKVGKLRKIKHILYIEKSILK